MGGGTAHGFDAFVQSAAATAAPSSASLRVAAQEAAVPWTSVKKMASEKVVAEVDAAAAEKESAHAEKESVHAVMKTKSVDPRFLGKPSLIGDLESIEEQHDAVLAVTSNRLRRKWANRLTERIKWAANFLGVGHWPLKSVWDSV